MAFIDSHHHLWELNKVCYPWLEARGSERFFGQPDPIRKNYLPEDYRQDHQDNIRQSVHIQVGCITEHNLRETQLIESYIECGAPIAAIVAAVDVRSQNLAEQLAQQCQYPHIKGVRHMIGKSPDENHQLPRFNGIEWITGWEMIADKQLSFDLQLTEEQYESVFQALQSVPQLNVVLCHFASPWDQSEAGYQRWLKAMEKFASLDNCFIKLSGFSMFTHSFNQANFIKYGLAAINLFGANRCMLGSNFPVDKLHMSFTELFKAWHGLGDKLDCQQKLQINAETAQRFYRMDHKQPEL
ncbi:amidohydrolase family protein [Thalassotalea litorea]|uniref:amidohydrolase family protein n=1 Tax=Thalassotalea litorea TaxID=2020715 RepID=UPI0037364764